MVVIKSYLRTCVVWIIPNLMNIKNRHHTCKEQNHGGIRMETLPWIKSVKMVQSLY